jgi:hypothetical protein
MRDAIAIARRWIAGIVAGVAILLAGGCGNWPIRCEHGVYAIKSDRGPYYMCEPKPKGAEQ